MATYAQLIKSSVQRAKAQIGDLAIEYTVRKKIGTTYFNGRNIPQYRDIVVAGVSEKYEAHEIDGNLVQITDSKILLFADSIDKVPDTGDLIVEGGQEFQVIKGQPIFAGQEVVAATVQARK